MKTLTLNPVDGLTITCQVEIIPAQKGGLDSAPVPEHVVLHDWAHPGVMTSNLVEYWVATGKPKEFLFDFIHRLCCEEIERQRELSNEP